MVSSRELGLQIPCLCGICHRLGYTILEGDKNTLCSLPACWQMKRNTLAQPLSPTGMYLRLHGWHSSGSLCSDRSGASCEEVSKCQQQGRRESKNLKHFFFLPRGKVCEEWSTNVKGLCPQCWNSVNSSIPSRKQRHKARPCGPGSKVRGKIGLPFGEAPGTQNSHEAHQILYLWWNGYFLAPVRNAAMPHILPAPRLPGGHWHFLQVEKHCWRGAKKQLHGYKKSGSFCQLRVPQSHWVEDSSVARDIEERMEGDFTLNKCWKWARN